MNITSTDRIEKRVLVKAPRARVWRALADAAEFGSWFGVDLAGSFVAGGSVRGKVTHKGYEHVAFDITIERMEPERLISWRWHPNNIEPGADYSAEPTTLVEFELDEVEDGVLVTVVESGFDAIPLSRRAEAYRGNEEGWAQQMQALERHVSTAA
jgi:uncharacterized protein YndB with AHSA1/START domain